MNVSQSSMETLDPQRLSLPPRLLPPLLLGLPHQPPLPPHDHETLVKSAIGSSARRSAPDRWVKSSSRLINTPKNDVRSRSFHGMGRRRLRALTRKKSQRPRLEMRVKRHARFEKHPFHCYFIIHTFAGCVK